MFDPSVIDFSSWEDEEERDLLKDLVDTLTRLEAWGEFETEPDGPAGKSDLAQRVYGELKYSKQHSGSTYSWCYCYIKMIMRLGWEEFMQERQEALDAMTEEERAENRRLVAAWKAAEAAAEEAVAAARNQD
jgi:hypothetical protein